DHSSSVGPALAGLVGGFILGSAVSHSGPVVHERVVYRSPGYDYAPAPQVCYYDPYSGRRFYSLDAWSDYCDRYDAPRFIEVIDVRTGACRDRLDYDDGRWVEYRGD